MGTECYRDPSQSSCFSFGNSGSGALRKTTIDGEERYAFAGPLSMSKSCDSIYIFDNQITYSSENPGIFTDAFCYLPWIAAMYGMKLPEGFKMKPSCSKSKGMRETIDEAVCLGQDAENLGRSRCKNWNSIDEKEKKVCWIADAIPYSVPCILGTYTYELTYTKGTGRPFYNTEYECQQDILKNGISKVCVEIEGPERPGSRLLVYPDLCKQPERAAGKNYRECDFQNQRYTKNGWDLPWNQCMLESREGYAYNIYMCKVNILQHLNVQSIPKSTCVRQTVFTTSIYVCRKGVCR